MLWKNSGGCAGGTVWKSVETAEAIFFDNEAFHDSGGLGEEKGRVKAVENPAGSVGASLALRFSSPVG